MAVHLRGTSTWGSESERFRFAVRDDIPTIARMLADPEVARWLWFTPAPPEAIERFFAPFIDSQTELLGRGEIPCSGVFVVEDARGAFLGQGAVVAVDGSPGGVEIGYQLPRSAWGRGVGIRLARFLCAYAVHQCDAYRLEAGCLEGNLGSRHILTKLGFKLEGTRPGYRLRDGVRHTELLYGTQVHDLDPAAILRWATDSGLVEGEQ